MYWARYDLVDQALRGGGMHSTECPSSYCIICVAYFYLWRFSCMGHSTFVSFNMLLNSVISWENIGFIELDLPTEKINLFGIWV